MAFPYPHVLFFDHIHPFCDPFLSLTPHFSSSTYHSPPFPGVFCFPSTTYMREVPWCIFLWIWFSCLFSGKQLHKVAGSIRWQFMLPLVGLFVCFVLLLFFCFFENWDRRQQAAGSTTLKWVGWPLVCHAHLWDSGMTLTLVNVRTSDVCYVMLWTQNHSWWSTPSSLNTELGCKCASGNLKKQPSPLFTVCVCVWCVFSLTQPCLVLVPLKGNRSHVEVIHSSAMEGSVALLC